MLIHLFWTRDLESLIFKAKAYLWQIAILETEQE